MSSLVERLRVRSDKRPLYTLDESDDDDFVPSRSSKGKQPGEKAEKPEPVERIVRTDAKEGVCYQCEEDGDLVSCTTCTYAYHKKCLYPVSRAAISESWSCPECVSPLIGIEKILDFEKRPAPAEADEASSSKPSPKKSPLKYYLVKWKGLSHLHCTWVPEKEFTKASGVYPRLKSRLSTFHKQKECNTEDDWVPIRPEYTTVDRIIGSRNKGDEREYFVKWKELGYDECTWEVESDISAFKSQIERYNLIQSRGREKSSTKAKSLKRETKELKSKQKEFQHYDHTPKFLTGGKLHPYQLEGLNFLRYSWSKTTHVILADEMGLGKTIQSIAFLASLFEEKLYPHLVVAPLSTLRNWEREFALWAPQMNVVMHIGSSQAREIIKQYEFYFPKQNENKLKNKNKLHGDKQKKQRKIKFDALLTSYEMINLDPTLKQIQWECMIVDEGHRLKNKDSKLFTQLKLYTTKHRVLLTGTPLQNNLDELFMLMHFLDAGKFACIEDFQKEFKDINQEEQIDRLHKMLAPHLLRRVKKDVMKDLPPKKELILRVELSPKQKEYYKAILTRNYQILARRGGAQISLINVVMELRKLCCHAYMLEGVEPATELIDAEGLRQFLDASGKLQLLDKMMVKLKEQGHRVLIYSQFQHMLDLLEDYLIYKKWAYERIDGKVSGAERQIRIDRFNAKNSTRFCFLLSTRAGGLGINLATADTVIIYDSDWNPHADLQAMARAHRLGQTSKVMIYRLITRGTIEERMMQMTKKKMILEHLVVGRLKAQTVNQEELDDIIRYGSKELFADESEEAKARQIHYDDAAIDRLLNRDQADGEEASVAEEDDDFLKAFKVANFAYIDEVEAEAALEEELKKQSSSSRASSSNAERANYWDELLHDKFEVQHIDELTTMGKGKRSRKQMAATDEDNIDISSEDEDYSYEEELSDNEPSVAGNQPGRRGQFSKKRTRDNSEPHPLMEGEGRSLKVLGFNQNQRSLFQQLIMRFGFQDYTWRQFAPKFKGKTLEEVHEYGKLFMKHIREDVNDSPTYSDGVPKEGARADDIMIRVGHIQLIEEKVEFISSNPGAPMFYEDISVQFPGLNGRFWKSEQDLVLLKAILKHGYARWQGIIEDATMGIADFARKELNLPSVPFQETLQTNESTTSANANGTAEINQYRELQKRLVEFIRKRYYLLEKALDLDHGLKIIIAKYEAQDRKTDQDPSWNEAASQDQQTDQDPARHEAASQDQRKDHNAAKFDATTLDSQIDLSTSEKNNPDMLKVKELLEQLPDLEHITIDETVYDTEDERLKIAFLYNELCKVVEGNALDSVQASLGDQSASLRLAAKLSQLEAINEDVCRTIADLGQSEVPEGSSRKLAVDGASTSISLESRALDMVGTSKSDQVAEQRPVKMDFPSSSDDVETAGSKCKDQPSEKAD